MQISLEAGSRRIKEQDEWAKELFPTVYERLKQAAETLSPDSPAQPFVDALTELVQAQADTTGFVVLHRWARRRSGGSPSPPSGVPGNSAIPAGRGS